MSEFDASLNGHTRYLPTGEAVVVDHIVGDAAYVHPIIVVQTTSYRGDDFDEEEVPADHLIMVSASKLSAQPPLTALQTEVAALKGQIADLGREKEAEKRDLSALRKDFMDLSNQVRTWRAKNPCFDRIVKLLNGAEMIALSIPSWKYRCDMPRRLDTNDAAVLQLISKGDGKFGWVGHWRKDHDRFGSERNVDVVEFFDTEDELQKFVHILWDEVLTNYDKTSDDVRFQRSGATGKMVTYKVLTEWVERFPFLRIPQHVEDAKVKYEAQHKADLLAAAKARVAELEDA